MGSNPVEAPKNFFSGYFRNCLNCDSLRWSHTHLISLITSIAIDCYRLSSIAIDWHRHLAAFMRASGIRWQSMTIDENRSCSRSQNFPSSISHQFPLSIDKLASIVIDWYWSSSIIHFIDWSRRVCFIPVFYCLAFLLVLLSQTTKPNGLPPLRPPSNHTLQQTCPEYRVVSPSERNCLHQLLSDSGDPPAPVPGFLAAHAAAFWRVFPLPWVRIRSRWLSCVDASTLGRHEGRWLHRSRQRWPKLDCDGCIPCKERHIIVVNGFIPGLGIKISDNNVEWRFDDPMSSFSNSCSS